MLQNKKTLPQRQRAGITEVRALFRQGFFQDLKPVFPGLHRDGDVLPENAGGQDITALCSNGEQQVRRVVFHRGGHAENNGLPVRPAALCGPGFHPGYAAGVLHDDLSDLFTGLINDLKAAELLPVFFSFFEQETHTTATAATTSTRARTRILFFIVIAPFINTTVYTKHRRKAAENF